MYKFSEMRMLWCVQSKGSQCDTGWGLAAHVSEEEKRDKTC